MDGPNPGGCARGIVERVESRVIYIFDLQARYTCKFVNLFTLSPSFFRLFNSSYLIEMATTTITIRTNGENTVIETTGSTLESINGGSINGSVKGWANGVTNGITNGDTVESTNGQHFAAASDVNADPDRVKFAYWVPNVSGGLVISKIPQRTK
jgi:hypothetical protein